MNLLLNERPLILLPSLVKAVGFERAAIIQQIHWLLQQPKNGIEHEGNKWVWGTYEEWCDQYFTFWEPRTLRYHMDKLEKEGWVISAQLRKEDWDRTKYYRINYEKFGASIGQQVDASEGQRVDASSIYTKTTTKTTNRSSSRAKANASQPHPETQAIIAAYIEVRGKNGINYQKEGSFAKKIAKDGYTPVQVKGCYLWLKSDPWWEDKPVTLDQLFKHMPEYVVWAEKQGLTTSSGELSVIDVDWNTL